MVTSSVEVPIFYQSGFALVAAEGCARLRSSIACAGFVCFIPLFGSTVLVTRGALRACPPGLRPTRAASGSPDKDATLTARSVVVDREDTLLLCQRAAEQDLDFGVALVQVDRTDYACDRARLEAADPHVDAVPIARLGARQVPVVQGVDEARDCRVCAALRPVDNNGRSGDE
jgi:hypothetical protein